MRSYARTTPARRVSGGWEVNCRRCRAPIVFAFEPTTSKMCDACYLRRTPEDVEEAEKDNLRRNRQDALRLAFANEGEYNGGQETQQA